MSRSNIFSILIVPTLLIACGGVKDETGDDTGEVVVVECNIENEECEPGVEACEGDEGKNMLPGANCISCHSYGNIDDGPQFSIAGTIFEDGAGTDGFKGAIVRIFDAAGNTFELTSTREGNFFTDEFVAFPISAEVEVDGNIRAMNDPIETGECNTCHTCEGDAGNKIFIP
jgi:hypothetical protein